MRWTIPFIALSLGLPAATASAALRDFRLPDASQQPAQDRQGPVAPDVPESRDVTRPPAPLPTRSPAPTPSPTATPRIVLPDLPEADPAPAATRTARAPDARPSPAPAAAPAAIADEPAPDAAATDTPPAAPSTPATASASDAAGENEGGSSWPWVLAALGALGALGLAGWIWRRRPAGRHEAVPQVERPRLTPAAAESAAPEPLQVTLEPLRLSLTLMNATLAYRLEIANRGMVPIVGLAIGADMISAHASMTREQQLSGPVDGAASLQRIERIEPGESRIVEGEFRVPFSQIVPIRQGNAALLLPLARFRLAAESAAPVVRTFAVGQSGANAALQPFRLDLGPRVYPKLTQRAFA